MHTTNRNAKLPAVFVTGTDTGIGKTLVSALLCRCFNAGYWKPIQSGTIDGTDCATVQQLSGLSTAHFYPEAYVLSEPLSPHASAALDGVQIELERIVPPAIEQKLLVIEGAGGIFVPLNDAHFVIDLIDSLQAPVILVARSTLGTINHTLLSLEALRRRRIPVLGVVLSGPLNSGNVNAIEKFGKVKVISQIPYMQSVTADSISQLTEQFTNDFKYELQNLASIYTDENSRFAFACETRVRTHA